MQQFSEGKGQENKGSKTNLTYISQKRDSISLPVLYTLNETEELKPEWGSNPYTPKLKKKKFGLKIYIVFITKIVSCVASLAESDNGTL